MEKHTFKVPNITCGHCVMTIKNELSELQGVNHVDGNPENKTIAVEWETPATLEAIKTTLTEINYPASE
jgi:copper chaperone CopZ